MDIGPVEILVVGFPGNQFNGEAAPALAELVESGLIRVIDLVFVLKDEAGDVVGVELADVEAGTGDAFRPVLSRSERDAVRRGHRRSRRRPRTELVRRDPALRARVGHEVP